MVENSLDCSPAFSCREVGQHQTAHTNYVHLKYEKKHSTSYKTLLQQNEHIIDNQYEKDIGNMEQVTRQCCNKMNTSLITNSRKT